VKFSTTIIDFAVYSLYTLALPIKAVTGTLKFDNGSSIISHIVNRGAGIVFTV